MRQGVVIQMVELRGDVFMPGSMTARVRGLHTKWSNIVHRHTASGHHPGPESIKVSRRDLELM